MDKKEALLKKLARAIISGHKQAAAEISEKSLKAGIDPLETIQRGASKGLKALGRKYERLEVFLPELIKGGDAMKACMAVLLPHIKPKQKHEASLGKVVIGTVSGDVHDIGKNLVATMLAISGFEVYDLGVDIPAKEFVLKAEAVEARVIALSALLVTTAYYQEEVINYLKDTGLREKYYVVIGGAPITPEWASQIGADGYGRNAVEATRVIKRLVTESAAPPLARVVVAGHNSSKGG